MTIAPPPSTTSPVSRRAFSGGFPRFSENNFDLLRLLLAVGVMLHHLPVLSPRPAFQWMLRFGESTAMVHSFFVISGFLIFMSYEKSKSLGEYLGNRLRRIYPAFLVLIVLTVLAGAVLTKVPLSDYFSRTTLRYFLCNSVFLIFLQPKLPGVFETNALHEVNGALWTLKIELAFYLCVPLIVWLMRRTRRGPVLLLLYLASFVYAEASLRYGLDKVAKQFPGQICFFVAGAALYYYFDVFIKNASLWFALAVGALYIDRVWTLGWLDPLSIGIVTIFIAYGLPRLPNPGRYGDLSYGVYIYHFPVIQAFQHFRVYKWNPYVGALLSFATVGALAYASWHLVEKRFLRRTSHYRQAAEEPASAVPA